MDDRPIHDRDVNDAMEVCRPGGDDLSDPTIAFLAAELAAHPELDARYEQIQRLDRKLAAAFARVPVPVGLAERIIVRLALSQLEEPTPAAPPVGGVVAAAESQEPRPSSHHRRRWMLVTVGGVAAVAASILVIVLVGSSNSRPMTKETVKQEATNRFAHWLETGPQEEPTDVTAPPAAYPFSPDLVRVPKIRWRWISDFLGCPGVAYDLVAQDQTRATLYVVRGTAAGLPSAPAEAERSAATEQFSVGAWQNHGLVYVLVVSGGPRQYRQFLDIARGPVT